MTEEVGVGNIAILSGSGEHPGELAGAARIQLRACCNARKPDVAQPLTATALVSQSAAVSIGTAVTITALWQLS